MVLIEQLVKAVPGMEIVEIKEVESIEEFQRKSPMERLGFALCTVAAEKGVIIKQYDYSWLYLAINEGCLKDIPPFRSVDSFRQQLEEAGIQNIPSNSTISSKQGCQLKKFPDWSFTDCDVTEAQRRINVVRRFLSLYNKGK
jgi:ASC-1-like (ASCH) protein